MLPSFTRGLNDIGSYGSTTILMPQRKAAQSGGIVLGAIRLSAENEAFAWLGMAPRGTDGRFGSARSHGECENQHCHFFRFKLVGAHFLSEHPMTRSSSGMAVRPNF